MPGEYGIGQGISQGLQQVTQGFNNAEQSSNKRLQVQQDAAKFQSTMTTQGLQQQNQEAQLQQTQLQLQELKKSIAKRDAFDSLYGFEQTGDASVLNTMKDNPMMKSIFDKMGVISFANIKDLSEEKQASLGITPEVLNDPTKRMVITTDADGNQTVKDMMPIYASSGFLPKLGEFKLKDMAMKSQEYKLKEEEVKSNQMEEFFKSNPTATYGDWVSRQHTGTGTTDTAEMKNINFEAQQLGITPEEVIKRRNEAKSQGQLPSAIKQQQYNIGKINTITQQAGVKSLGDVDINKLDETNFRQLEAMAAEEAKKIDQKEYNALAEIQMASSKLDPKDLTKTTGIADATFNKVLDTLGIDLPDNELVQSANYNLIKNTITRLNSGQTVTGGELDRIIAQIGSEFKSDRTVQVKTAEMLENIAAKYKTYKDTNPAFYARYIKPRVDSMEAAANKIRGNTTETAKPTQPKEGDTKVWQGKTYKVINNQWVLQGVK